MLLGKTLYTARATAVGGRSGPVRSDDGVLDLQLAPPRKRVPGATNPEQLFACGFAACFGSALAEVGPRFGIDATAAHVDCAVDLGTVDTPGAYGLAVTLTVRMAGADPEALRKAVEAADEVCPYSNAVRGNVTVTLQTA